MTLEEVLIELYRLAETKEWDGEKTDEALSSALEGMEQIWELTEADNKRMAMINAKKKQPRVWC
jgi:predicted house-cleaning noncanonical NTP pyrophosphatase (MazG superfamily)